MPDDELDWRAEFEKIANRPDFQVLEERMAAEHPKTFVWADEDDIAVRIKGDRGYVAMNVPVEVLQGSITALRHVQDHQCQWGMATMNAMHMQIMQAIYNRLHEEEKLPPDDLEHGTE